MTLMTLAYAICNVPVAPVRNDPSHKAEMSTQLLFGEKVIIKEKDEKSSWVKIMCEWDHYEGWVKDTQLQIIDKRLYKKEILSLSGTTSDAIQMGEYKTYLPVGASLFNMKAKTFEWYPTNEDHRYVGKRLKLKEVIKSGESIVNNALLYFGAPYLWGGRTHMGIDCSGLSQMAYRLADLAIYRDAAQQIDMGEPVDFLFNALPGDLAFFDNEEGKIIHVGILMCHDKIIHATESGGGVVIDTIDNGGIISARFRKRTHQLRMIKRIIN